MKLREYYHGPARVSMLFRPFFVLFPFSRNPSGLRNSEERQRRLKTWHRFGRCFEISAPIYIEKRTALKENIRIRRSLPYVDKSQKKGMI